MHPFWQALHRLFVLVQVDSSTLVVRFGHPFRRFCSLVAVHRLRPKDSRILEADFVACQRRVHF